MSDELRELVAKWRQVSERYWKRYSGYPCKEDADRRDFGLSDAYVTCADELAAALAEKPAARPAEQDEWPSCCQEAHDIGFQMGQIAARRDAAERPQLSAEPPDWESHNKALVLVAQRAERAAFEKAAQVVRQWNFMAWAIAMMLPTARWAKKGLPEKENL